MMNADYKELLLKSATALDAVSYGDGKISAYAVSIADELSSSATLAYCKQISEISNAYKGDKRVLEIAKKAKDCLIDFYGYQKVRELCNQEINNTQASEREDLTLNELLCELNQLVGLHHVKAKVNDLIAFQKIQQLRKASGLSIFRNTLHLAFTGNPGTGKTTVARIVGRLYKQIGLLSKGHFLEVSRTDLIAGYQGQTALKVKEVIERAKGGVLFIDEAYSITENDHSDSYGRECLTELTKALEDYRDDLVVIVAGYTEPMKKFFESNPGLKSRFNTFIEFDDYTEDELMEIMQGMCNKNEYIICDDALKIIRGIFHKQLISKEGEFANGRYVRNVFDKLIMNQARRLANVDRPDIITLQYILPSDIDEYEL